MGEPSARATTPGTPMRRIAAACLVGSAIEFYDFLIYGTAAALVFPAVFFPRFRLDGRHHRLDGDLRDGLLSRPLGAAVFGYFGTGWAARRPWSPPCSSWAPRP